jgi:hypothetical protein
MDNKRTSKLQAILKVANAKKQVVAKIPVNQLLQHAKACQAKKACAATPPSLYCRLAASMKKTAEEEKKETPKSEPSKSESSKAETTKPIAPKPAVVAPKPAAPKPTIPQAATPPPATAGQGASPSFDWQSVLKTLQPYAAPAAIGTGVGALGSLMLPQGSRPGESAQQYQRRQRNRMIGGGLAGGGATAALLAAYYAYKARKGLAMP